MTEHGDSEVTVVHKKPRKLHRKSVLGTIAYLAAALIIFGGGILVGRGDVRFGSQSLNKGLPERLDYSSVNQLYNLLKTDFDGKLDANKLVDGIKAGLVDASGDPYTEYFSAKDARDFNDQLSGSFSGIGAELGTNSDNQVIVVSPLAGYPAEKAGLKTKDIIVAIDGTSTSGISVDRAVQKIRGPLGSKVTLSVSRGGGKPFDITITREKINVPSVTHRVDGSIGYIKINQFNQDTTDLAKKAAADLKSQNIKAVVLDLRGNPGGYLSAAVDVSSLWLPEGKTVVQEKRGNQIISTEYSHGQSPLAGLPTIVLIDGGSASASEITAGALHDNNAATLVGQKSFGKGSVQQVENLSGGAEVKITIARWYTPAGKNIDKQGITPDISVSITDDQLKSGQDPQKDKAYQLLQSKIQ